MRTVSKEFGKNGVNVNAIAPRVIVTDLFDTLYPTEESKEQLMAKIPIGRFGYPGRYCKSCMLPGSSREFLYTWSDYFDGWRTDSLKYNR